MADIPKTAAAYIRVSTEEQTEYSPDAQLVEIRRYGAKNGFIVPDELVYTDEGISGRSTDHREGFKRMIGAAKSKTKPFEAILLWKFSRFARNREDAVVYKSMLRRQGVDVISITEPTTGDGPTSTLMEAMIEAMDEYYSVNLSQEVRRGMTEKARRGGLQSTPSFGYMVKDNTLVPIEPEASYVKEIFKRYLNGDGFFPIAKWLNQLGIKTHRGNKFENRTIEYILRNPVYIGKLRWNPTGRSRRDFDNENIILADSEHESLIDIDTWNAVQKSIKAQKAIRPYHARPTYDRKDWLSGIVRCAACGGTLVFAKPHYFKCNNYVRGGCKFSQHVHVDRLHEAVIDRLRLDAISPAAISFEVIYQTGSISQELTKLEKSLSALQRKKDRLREAYLAGADSVEEYARSKAEIQAEIDVLAEQIDGLKSADSTVDRAQQLKDKITTCLDVLESSDTSIEQKYNAANAIIERCTFDKLNNTLVLTYRLIL